ncbi:baseplate assembly protein [Moraxella bovoculi]|uniref:Baseplate assembly protein n=1 Tax=Moraxella bovoculi TaxID=386891 RepID=A0AAC8PX48_9GAMM|nr:baseplate J/gp47 family protein [Moraxella bovoculi]AKG08082.1 baseplate assembly protein [Moraxella bovoculi]AKG11197.1 baseplate assembly protein [Moraxella bovoculi]
MSVDFNNLAKPDMIETLDYETILNNRKQALIARFDGKEQDNIRTILARESEPLTKFIEENAYRELILRNRINAAARACLLAYATGADLDHLAANFDMQRLITTAATDDRPAVYESDEVFRARVQRAFDRLSVAGPEAAYKYHCLSADGRVADVAVISPSPAVVNIAILQSDSQTGEASDELVNIVSQAVNAEHVRPIADRVSVQSAQIHRYRIEAKLYIGKDPEASAVLATATAKTRAYTESKNRIGRSVRLTAIHHCLHIDGVARIELLEPKADIAISALQAAYCESIDISIGGIE